MTPNLHALAPPPSLGAVSWRAVLAGALAASMLSLLLFILGIGLGFSSISIWSGEGLSASAFGTSAIIWLVVTQLVSAAVGGYMAGRLRSKWDGLHQDEAYFRDTAHGFLSWCVATIVMLFLAGSALTSLVSGTTKAVGSAVSQTAQIAASTASTALSVGATAGAGALAGQALEGLSMDDLNYWVNSLMRNNGLTEQQSQNLKNEASQLADRAERKAEDAKEITSIFVHALQKGQLAEADAAYAARLVSRHADVSQAEAEQAIQKGFAKVQETMKQAQQALKDAAVAAQEAAETARKAAAHGMLWVFVVLLIGAFVGSLSATVGGRQRDSV